MKTRNILVYGVFAVILALACIACDNNSTTEDPAPAPAPTPTPEQPKAQSAVITGLFDNNASATVKGTFTDTEWAGVADKIKTALNTGFEKVAPTVKNTIKGKYAVETITIIVEKIHHILTTVQLPMEILSVLIML
jgi:hypothetical protein